jgi:transposase
MRRPRFCGHSIVLRKLEMGGVQMARKKRGRRGFTPEFRQEAVKLMNERLDEGVALAQIGRDLDLEPDQLRRWARDLGQWRSETISQDPSSMTEAERESEIRRLRRELEVVKQERDFLKKATAFFAKGSH